MPDLDNIGDTIKELREIRGWGQVDLEDRSGVGRGAISKYECGENVPGLGNLTKIAQAFDARPSELLDDAGL